MMPPAKASASAAPSADRHSISVWLVEDNDVFRNTVARVFAHDEGIECDRRFDKAEDALNALLGGAVPDVVLLDVKLPGMNGIEAVSKIKSISPTTRVVMLTVFDDHEKIFKAICAGASGYLLKDSSAERIVESVHEVLDGGAPLTPRVAKSVLDTFASFSRPSHDYGLTRQEKTVLDLSAQGLAKKEIADRLDISHHTVGNHLRNIYTKLHVHSRSGAVGKALQERLIH